MVDRPAWGAVLQINRTFLSASFSAGIAWLFARIGAPGWTGWDIVAILFGYGALKGTVRALLGIFWLIQRDLTWSRYRARGAAPKADQLANDADLKAKGLIK